MVWQVLVKSRGPREGEDRAELGDLSAPDLKAWGKLGKRVRVELP